MLYDAIVVGGGPAGGSAAYTLGEAGWRTLVLEKESLPRYKTCGGGLSPRMLAHYFPFSFEPVIATHCRWIHYVLGENQMRVPLYRDDLAMVMRADLDAYILAHTRAKVRTGCAVSAIQEEGDQVRVTTRDGEVFQARYLIGADGANSVVAHSLGLRRKRTLVAAIEAECPVPEALRQRFADGPVFIFGQVNLGYAWIFPKGDHLSVGVGAYHPQPGQLQARLAEILGQYAIPAAGARITGHPLPIYLPGRKIAARRTLLVGDAAGLVDPLSGEGIRLAVKSGHLAAQALLAGKPGRYSAWVRRSIGASQNLALPLIPIFYYLAELAFLLGVCNPFASQAFMDLLADQTGYFGVLLRIFGTLPAFALTEAAGLVGEILGGKAAQQRIRTRIYGLPNQPG